jgi:outer membrane receptor for ferrienterochelin and colicins
MAVATSFDSYEDGHVAGQATHRSGEQWRFDGAGDYTQRDLRGIEASATGAVFDRRNLVESATARTGATWSGERTALRVEADASLYRDQFLADQRGSDALDQFAETRENLVEGRAQIAHDRAGHRVMIGGELLREALSSDRLAMPGDRYRGALFAQDEWRLGETDQISIVPAARVDADSQFGMHATPRLAARWQIDDVVTRASVGMGYRAPSFKELLLLFANPGVGYVVEGNPDLEPETSLSAQLGAEWQAMPWLRVYADAYANRLRDMIFEVAKPDDGSGTLRFGYDNIGRARSLGFELYALATHGRAGLELGFAMTRARDLDANHPLDGIPANRATLTTRWRDKRAGIDAFATAVFTGHRPFYLASGTALTDRRVEVRARIAKRFGSGLGGFMGVDNALDSGDARLDPVLPRTLYAGVEIHR